MGNINVMITFSNHQKAFSKLKSVIENIKGAKRDKLIGSSALENVLYIFSAANSRGHIDIYISPNIPNFLSLIDSISKKFPDLYISGESLGRPPWKSWIAFTPRIREARTTDCAKIAIFTELFINNKVHLTRS